MVEKYASYRNLYEENPYSQKLNTTSGDVFSELYLRPTTPKPATLNGDVFKDVKILTEQDNESKPITVVDKSNVIEKPTTPTIKRDNPFKVNDDLLGFLDLAKEMGINLKVTSGLREGAITSKGLASHHATGRAIDIVPGEGETWETIRKKFKNNTRMQEYLKKTNLGILDETTEEMLRRTGGTGAHWHIGPDRSALAGVQKIIMGQEGLKFATYKKYTEPIVNSLNSVGNTVSDIGKYTAELGSELYVGTEKLKQDKETPVIGKVLSEIIQAGTSPLIIAGSAISQVGSLFKSSPSEKKKPKDLLEEEGIDLDFIRQHEGFKHEVYLDSDKKIPTIGYGTTDKDVVAKGYITREEAEKYLRRDVNNFLKNLKTRKYWNNLNSKQKTALTSLVYNIGWAGFTTNSPKLQKYLSRNDWKNAALEMDHGYNTKGSGGLRNRRDAERILMTSKKLGGILKLQRGRVVHQRDNIRDYTPIIPKPSKKLPEYFEKTYSQPQLEQQDNSYTAVQNRKRLAQERTEGEGLQRTQHTWRIDPTRPVATTPNQARREFTNQKNLLTSTGKGLALEAMGIPISKGLTAAGKHLNLLFSSKPRQLGIMLNRSTLGNVNSKALNPTRTTPVLRDTSKEAPSLKFFEKQGRTAVNPKPRYANNKLKEHPLKGQFSTEADLDVIHRSFNFIEPDDAGNIVWSPKYFRDNPRLTHHFTLDRPVIGHGSGSWDSASETMITPLKGLVKENSLPLNIDIMDTYFASPSKFTIPKEGTKILTGNKLNYKKYLDKGITAEYSPESAKLLKHIKNVETKLYVPKKLGFDDVRVQELPFGQYEKLRRSLDNLTFKNRKIHEDWVLKNRKVNIDGIKQLEKETNLSANLFKPDPTEHTQTIGEYTYYNSPPTHQNTWLARMEVGYPDMGLHDLKYNHYSYIDHKINPFLLQKYIKNKDIKTIFPELIDKGINAEIFNNILTGKKYLRYKKGGQLKFKSKK